MEIQDRILVVIEQLGLNKNSFSNSIGIQPQTLHHIVSGRRTKPSFDVIEKIISTYSDIDSTWLITGVGNVFNKNTNLNTNPNTILLDKTVTEDQKTAKTESKNVDYIQTPERHLIPFYDIQAIAGRYSGADMTPVIASTEMIDAGDWFHDATAAMRIYGDSMNPDYKSGTIVALKEVHDKRIILYGDDYVIETDEIRVLKRLQRADERGCWLACSTNQEIWEQGPQKGRLVHEPFEVPIDMVRRLYLVVGEVNRKHGNIINFNER